MSPYRLPAELPAESERPWFPRVGEIIRVVKQRAVVNEMLSVADVGGRLWKVHDIFCDAHYIIAFDCCCPKCGGRSECGRLNCHAKTGLFHILELSELLEIQL